MLPISDASLIACLCEGGAETAIMNLLLDHDRLIFRREQLIEEKVLPRCSGKVFEKRYLSQEYDQPIVILRIIDSRKENFRLDKAYCRQVLTVMDVVTAPEIEMLVIAGMGQLDSYSRSGYEKPSEYCTQVLKLADVKKPAFIACYFSDPDLLVDSIRKYAHFHQRPRGKYLLADLLK
jgi:hypothetical protein